MVFKEKNIIFSVFVKKQVDLKGEFVMRKAIKKHRKKIIAYELGKDDEKIFELVEEGKIVKISDNQYEVFSQEAKKQVGEIAEKGDFIKFDSSMNPYPNKRDYFMGNHIFITGNEYEQIPKQVLIWQLNESIQPEIEFLMKNKGLVVNEEYIEAPLWGTVLTAESNAFLVVYNIEKNENGEIQDIDFNFVENKEFMDSYVVI